MLLCVDLMVKASWTFRLVTYCSVFLTMSYSHWSEWSVSIVCGDASLYLHFDSHHHRRMKARIISCLIDPDPGHTYLGEGLVLTLPHSMSPHPPSIYLLVTKLYKGDGWWELIVIIIFMRNTPTIGADTPVMVLLID